MIEAALAKSRGKVAGPKGAAATIGVGVSDSIFAERLWIGYAKRAGGAPIRPKVRLVV